MDPIVDIMKTSRAFVVVTLLCGLLAAGCGVVGTGVAPAFPDSSSQSDDAPRYVTPVTGGGMILATPAGGAMYEPVTGGAPFVGI